MKLRLATIAVLLFATVTAFAQEWRLEIGTGMQPIHMGWTGVSPSSILKSRLADKGQYINTNVGFYPMPSYQEFVAIAGVGRWFSPPRSVGATTV